jgi:hypothetical protein
MIQSGTYRHYKNKLYQVIDVATHSETLEKMVVYKPLYGEEKLWVRPLKMFEEEIVFEGKLIKRFTLIEEIAQ